MSRRFFSQSPIGPGAHRLDGSEAHHLIHVMRAQPGDTFVLFDGSGHEFAATVTTVARKEVDFLVGDRTTPDRELPRPVRLYVALPRGDRQEWLVQKAVEVGVTSLTPWHTDRSVARLKPKSLERLQRTVIEASKQCGRNVLMEIDEPRPFHDAVQQADVSMAFLAHLDVEQPLSQRWTWNHTADRGVALGIGPEGGFTEEEVALALAHRWQTVSLGPRILRSETAAITLAAWCAMHPTMSHDPTH